MMQGTTPTVTIRLPFNVSLLVDAEFIIADYGAVVRKWMLADMEAEGNVLKFKLTQEDSLGLDAKVYQVQLRVKLIDDVILVSKISKMSVSELLAEGAI